MARILSVNVGRPRGVRAGGRSVSTAIWKHPVEGSVAVRGVNLEGDDQADRTTHGGVDKAVYAYAIEDTGAWERELGRELGQAPFGENLTTEGLDVSGALVGERWCIGTAVLEVAQPRLPCFKLGLRLGDPSFPQLFVRARRPGAYLRIVQEGTLRAGDTIEVADRPAHGVSVRLVSDAIVGDRHLIPQVLDAPQLPEGLREWLTHALARRSA